MDDSFGRGETNILHNARWLVESGHPLVARVQAIWCNAKVFDEGPVEGMICVHLPHNLDAYVLHMYTWPRMSKLMSPSRWVSVECYRLLGGYVG